MSKSIRSCNSDLDSVKGLLLFDELMSLHTSWRVGGPARYFFIPETLEDLSVFMRSLDKNIPILMLGLGSNILVRDGGFPGAVISLHQGLSNLIRVGDFRIRAEAGVACARFSRFASLNSLSGAEFLSGIPGTIGGALAMNAGAFGEETWKLVKTVQLINRNGIIEDCESSEFSPSYRKVGIPTNQWFVSGEFELHEDFLKKGREKIRSMLIKRGNNQPIRQPSAGSVFKNPPGEFAARLIELSGLKGHRIGGAIVSEKHANFILNDANASAGEIELLINHVKEVVISNTGISLDTEVQFIGEKK